MKTIYTNAGKTATIGDGIHYVYTVTNNGLLTLYNITLQSNSLSEEGFVIDCVDTDNFLVGGPNVVTLSELEGFPDKGLTPAAFLTCTATDTITQAEVITYGTSAAILSSITKTNIIPKPCGYTTEP